jgi:hypothetical protein
LQVSSKAGSYCLDISALLDLLEDNAAFPQGFRLEVIDAGDVDVDLPIEVAYVSGQQRKTLLKLGYRHFYSLWEAFPNN